MNKSVEVLNEIYKPYRYTKKNKTIIIETTSGNFVIKEKSDVDIKDLYNYLASRDFYNYAPLIEDNRKDVNVYEYIEENTIPKEQKALDLVNVLSSLHNKTTYFKDVTPDTYQEIYDTILANINYIKESYLNHISNIENEVFMAPSHYLFIRNSSKILSALAFCEEELNNWFEFTKENIKQRVAVIHNNVELDHFYKGEKEVLISWDHSKVDSPVLDLIHFYKKEYFNIPFDAVFEKYNERYPLDEAEKKLFFIVISLPQEIKFESNEFINCKNIRYALDYTFKTELLVRPYYAKDEITE